MYGVGIDPFLQNFRRLCRGDRAAARPCIFGENEYLFDEISTREIRSFSRFLVAAAAAATPRLARSSSSLRFAASGGAQLQPPPQPLSPPQPLTQPPARSATPRLARRNQNERRLVVSREENQNERRLFKVSVDPPKVLKVCVPYLGKSKRLLQSISPELR